MFLFYNRFDATLLFYPARAFLSMSLHHTYPSGFYQKTRTAAPITLPNSDAVFSSMMPVVLSLCSDIILFRFCLSSTSKVSESNKEVVRSSAISCACLLILPSASTISPIANFFIVLQIDFSRSCHHHYHRCCSTTY